MDIWNKKTKNSTFGGKMMVKRILEINELAQQGTLVKLCRLCEHCKNTLLLFVTAQKYMVVCETCNTVEDEWPNINDETKRTEENKRKITKWLGEYPFFIPTQWIL